MKLMKLYYLALQEIKTLPDEYPYKFLSRELTRYRMKIVDENMSVREIERKIGAGVVEELIFAAHNEVKLLRLVGKWMPWEDKPDPEEEREMLQNFAAFKTNNPFPVAWDSYDDMRHDRKPRKKPNAQ